YEEAKDACLVVLVPELGIELLMSLGLAGLAATRRRRVPRTVSCFRLPSPRLVPHEMRSAERKRESDFTP
ncbi:MAG: hypothetical protein ABGX04_01890, partial [Myxococcales bacterium]